MMKKLSIIAVLVALAVIMAGSAQAAFTVGGENGWSLSTDGIVNLYSAYQTTTDGPSATDHAFSFLGNDDTAVQKFGIRVGLLPSIIALNVKAPVVNGIESMVRVSFWPNLQNNGLADSHNESDTRFNTNPNIDNREFYYTAKGKYGELLVGRALNLFQGQNILNDITLFTAGVVDMTTIRGGTSLGRIAYGYLYTNFGPQFRYTTPDFAGVKFALEVGEPYQISNMSFKQNTPRVETELSYATTFKGGSVHAWLEGMWQQDVRAAFDPAAAVPYDRLGNGKTNTALGIAPGFQAQIGPVGLGASGYYGRGLGMFSAQDGDQLEHASTDAYGVERHHFGYLVQGTYNVTDAIKLAASYGQTMEALTDSEAANKAAAWAISGVPKKCQEAIIGQVNYMWTKFIQFTAEYVYAKDTWMDHASRYSNQAMLGSVFYW